MHDEVPMNTPRLAAAVIVLLVMIMTSGCATTSNKAVADLSLRKNTERILLMPMDIELSELTAGGVLEPNAAWTADANRFVHEAISEKIASQSRVQVTDLNIMTERMNAEERNLQTQLIKLHEAVGQTILLHKYIAPFKLPNKSGLDWTLGEKAGFLKEKFDADYALFIYLRDSYASAGRVGVIIVAAALGVGVSGGQQVGFASLVDLNTGQVVWFNRLMRTVGDLRNREDAASSIDELLVDFPT